MSAASSRLKLVGHQPNRSIGAAGSIELVRIGPCLRSRCSELGAPFPTRTVPDHPLWCGRAQAFLVDCGRGVLQRAAAVGVGAAGLSAVLLTHLHGDVLITSWVTNFAADPAPLPIIGPPGTPKWWRRR